MLLCVSLMRHGATCPYITVAHAWSCRAGYSWDRKGIEWEYVDCPSGDDSSSDDSSGDSSKQSKGGKDRRLMRF